MTDATDAYDTGSTPASATDSGATPTAPRRFDPLALIFGLLFLGPWTGDPWLSRRPGSCRQHWPVWPCGSS
jgi:hypothetical protein